MFMHRIKVENMLSFGPETQELELKPLNVLIGPNGAGKSNLIEVIGLLRAAPSDVGAPVREGGGSENWFWRGEQDWPAPARVEIVVNSPFRVYDEALLHYSLALSPHGFGAPFVEEETIEGGTTEPSGGNPQRFLWRKRANVVLTYRGESGEESQRELPSSGVRPDQSMLSQLRDAGHYPEITYLGWDLASIHFYREWSFGRNTPPRLPQKADLPNHFLAEDGTNLGMVLNRLRGEPKAKNKLLAALSQLYHGVDDFDVRVEAGSVQVFLQEGDITMPATRLSDGTLRYLCLLAILCHPSPPPLVCLEEPELGLHPDILPGLADLLREASEKCQLIVTTHSDVLVDALTDMPESIVVCEKENGRTRLKRLDRSELSHWLEKYRLGELWTSGELGGNRW